MSPQRLRLHELDRSSTGFPEQLDKLLRDEQWAESLELLPEGKLRELIGYLDNLLDDLDPTGDPFRECLCLLQKICGSQMILPSTYNVPSELSYITTDPVVSGLSCDTYRGYLGLENVCIKRLRGYTGRYLASAKQALCRQAVLWKHLNHPNIVTFRGVTFEPVQIVSEWISGESLREYVQSNCPKNLIGLLLDIAKGLGYLHSRSVIHGSITGENIQVDATGHAKIISFGRVTVGRDSESPLSSKGRIGFTHRFAAPEILKGEPCSKESDVFAFWMVIIEVFTGKSPYHDCITPAVMRNIISGVHPERPTHPNFVNGLWKLTQRCWAEKPQDRPQIDLVIQQLSVYQVPQSVSVQSVQLYG